VPAYLSTSIPHAVTGAKADNLTTMAKFMVISVDPNDSARYIVQGNGIYKFPSAHGYTPSLQYYLSDTVAGGVTTVPPVNAQPINR